MKKLLSTLTLVIVFVPVLTLAVSESANQGDAVQNSVTTQTQTQTSNPGTGTMVQTRTEEQVQALTQQDVESTKQTYQVKNETAGSRSSEVAKSVQGILSVANRINNPEIGEQIRVIAKAQNEAEDKANKAVDKMNERSSFVKFFVGADFGQIKEVKQIMTQNQERIRELQQIMLKLENEADKTEIQNQITVLELQNLNLANQLDEEATGFTLFGWLIRWFYGV